MFDKHLKLFTWYPTSFIYLSF